LLISNANLEVLGFGKRATSIRVEGDSIARIGRELGARPAEQVIDAGGRIVLPGFIDSHAHLLFREFDLISVDLAETTSVDEIISLLEAKSKEVGPSEWIIGNSWDDSKIADFQSLNKDRLDRLGTANPIFLQRICGHIAVLNSTAFAILSESSDFGRIEHLVDPESGFVREDALQVTRRLVKLDFADRVTGVRRAVQEVLALGVTSLCEMHSTPEQYAVLSQGARPLQVFVYLNFVDERSFEFLAQRRASPHCRASGLKLVVDGSIGARTAAVSKPYSGTSEKGMLLFSPERILRVVREATERNVQLAIHAIGDLAVDAVLSAFEHAGASKATWDCRHRLEHCELLPAPLERTVERIKSVGLVASMQPNFISNWARPDGLYGQRFGDGWAGTNAFGPLRRSGVVVAFGSDSMPPGPVYGLRGAVEHPHEPFRLSLSEAVEAYTSAGAYAVFEERRLGRLVEGAQADIVILNCRQPADLLHSGVFAVVKKGELVHKAAGPAPPAKS